MSALQPGAPATNERRLEPVGGGRQVVSRPSGAADGQGQRADGPSCRQVGRHADQGQAQAGRACARGRHGTWRASPALLAARVPPTLRRAGGGAPRTGLQLGRGGFGVGGGLSFGVPELAAGTMGGAGAHDPWATAKHASGVRKALTPERRAPPILDLRRAKNTVCRCVCPLAASEIAPGAAAQGDNFYDDMNLFLGLEVLREPVTAEPQQMPSQPDGCDDATWAIVCECLAADAAKRPTAQACAERLRGGEGDAWLARG